jgi:hypothetical protein
LAKPGRKQKHRLAKIFYIEPELLLQMELRLTRPGAKAPEYGAQSDLINALIRKWIGQERAQDVGTSEPRAD